MARSRRFHGFSRAEGGELSPSPGVRYHDHRARIVIMRRSILFSGLAAILGASVSMGAAPSLWSTAPGGSISASAADGPAPRGHAPGMDRGQAPGMEPAAFPKVVSIGGFLAGGSGMALRRLSRAGEAVAPFMGLETASAASAHGSSSVAAARGGQTGVKWTSARYQFAGNDPITVWRPPSP